jgi:hypothetical protein
MIHAYRVWKEGESRPPAPNFEAHARRIAAEMYGAKCRPTATIVVHVERHGKIESFDVALRDGRTMVRPHDE